MFKVGDKFIVEVTSINRIGEDTRFRKPVYAFKDLDVVRFSENDLKMLGKYNETEAYTKGLNDAWEAARKICAGRFAGKIDTGHILNFTATEALDKIKAYEEEQSEIRVGDEVEINDSEVIVTYVRGSKMFVLYGDGSTEEVTVNHTEIRKTGRHFDEVEKLIEVLKGGEGSDEISF